MPARPMGHRQESIHPPPDGCTVDDYVEVTGGGKLGVKGKVLKVEDRWSGAEGNMRWKLQLRNGSIAWAETVIPSTKEAMESEEVEPSDTHLHPRVSIVHSQGTDMRSTASGASASKEIAKQDTSELVRVRTRATSEAAAVAEVQDETGFAFEKPEKRFLQTKRTEASIIVSPIGSEKTSLTAAEGKSYTGLQDSSTISTTTFASERNHLSPGRSQNWEVGPLAQRPASVSRESLDFTDYLKSNSKTSLAFSEAGTLSMPVRSASAEPRSGMEERLHKVSMSPRMRADSKTSLLDLPSPRQKGARGRALSDHAERSASTLGKKLSLPGSTSPRHPRNLFPTMAQVDEPDSPTSKS